MGEPDDDEPLDEAAMAERMDAMREELAKAPVEIVVANHAYGLFELAAVYLSQVPPLLDQSRVAIDALAGMLDALAGRLGEAEANLQDGLAQLRMAYVQIDGAQRAGSQVTGQPNGTTAPPPAAPDPTAGDGGQGTDPEQGPAAS